MYAETHCFIDIYILSSTSICVTLTFIPIVIMSRVLCHSYKQPVAVFPVKGYLAVVYFPTNVNFSQVFFFLWVHSYLPSWISVDFCSPSFRMIDFRQRLIYNTSNVSLVSVQLPCHDELLLFDVLSPPSIILHYCDLN